MQISADDIKIVTPLAVPFISALIETWIKPKLSKLYKKHNADSQVLEQAFADKFEEYLTRSFEKHSFLTVLVFQNQQKKLENIYIPMTVVSEKKEVRIKIDNYKEEFIPKHKKILITDTAGMGKSTLMKFLFLACVKRNEGIPVFVDLRKLNGANTILDYLIAEINPIDDEFDKDFILKLIRKGDFVFFLDGFDEIPLDQRSEVTSGLQDFISKARNNCFIMTSRPESALASFTSFTGFQMQPLEVEEAFDLIKKYDENGELSKEIISKIKGETLNNIVEFLTNPLLVSLLYKSYDYKPTIPLKKHIFYRQVYDSLFESHDLTKGGAFVRQKYTKKLS